MNIKTDKIVLEFGRLKSVHSFTFVELPNNISAIQLSFEKGDVFHEALADTDEISCSTSLIENYEISSDISKASTWVPVIGKEVLWIWRLTNQQGYQDAIQYSFTSGEGEIFIQLIVEASTIKLLMPGVV